MKYRYLAGLVFVALLILLACSSTSNTITSNGTGTLYYTTQGDSSVWAYSLALANGSLTQIGDTLGTGTFPTAIALAPSLNALFVLNQASDSISSYSIDSTGVLTPITGTVATGKIPTAIAINPGGNYMFVANEGSNNVSAYSVSGTTLTPVAGSPFTTIPLGSTAPTAPTALVVSASGNFLYVTNNATGTLAAFSINTGKLTPLGQSPYTVGTAPSGIGIVPSGAFLYVANSGSNNVSAFAICDKVVTSCASSNVPDGTLTALTGSPFTLGSGDTARSRSPPTRISLFSTCSAKDRTRFRNFLTARAPGN